MNASTWSASFDMILISTSILMCGIPGAYNYKHYKREEWVSN